MTDLKPCPFCGKQPQEHYEYGSQLHGIRCVDGGKNTKHVLISSYGYTPEEAVISWNTRYEAAKAPDQPVEQPLGNWDLEINYALGILSDVTPGLCGEEGILNAKRGLHRLFAALKARHTVRESGGWQPLNTAPKDGTKFLAWCSETGRQGHDIAWWHGEGRTGYFRTRHGWIAECWMPLPNPPITTSIDGGK